MNKNSILVAGATGAVGMPLVRHLVQGGYDVFGLTRSQEKAKRLSEFGCHPIVGNVYDLQNLRHSLESVEASIVIDQLTDLPFGLPEHEMKEGRQRNARIRDEGTRNLLSAIRNLRPRKLIAQSIAFCHGTSQGPFTEADPIENDSIAGYEALLNKFNTRVTILRYGPFYGPGTGIDEKSGPGAITVETAARATILAMESDATGTFHICSEGPYSTEKASTIWPSFRTILNQDRNFASM